MLMPEDKLEKMRTVSCYFKIGDMVTAKHIGTLWAGQIIALLPFNIYASYNYEQAVQNIETWHLRYDKLGLDFPHPKDGLVYFAYIFVEPGIRPLTLEEFKTGYEESTLNNKELKALYDKTIPCSNMLLHPVIDLEKIE